MIRPPIEPPNWSFSWSRGSVPSAKSEIRLCGWF
jgi:hypothetical protein